MTTPIADALKAGKALIADEANWTQGACARQTKKGDAVAFDDLNATCFCSYGAIMRVYGKPDDAMKAVVAKVFNEHFENYPMTGLVAFNDTRSHAQIMAKWDEMIAIAEKEGV